MSSETTNITNHTTRILRIALPNVEGRHGLLKLVLMPGTCRVHIDTWKKCVSHPGVQAWMKKGSLRNRTGGFIADRAMISTDRKASTAGIPKVEPSTSAKPFIPKPLPATPPEANAS